MVPIGATFPTILHGVRNRVRPLSRPLSRTDSIHPTNLEAIFVAPRAARGSVGREKNSPTDRRRRTKRGERARIGDGLGRRIEEVETGGGEGNEHDPRGARPSVWVRGVRDQAAHA